MVIRQLSPQTINRIAAGEVVERPSSVVKELVENAIDAGATRIEVVTVQGGISLVRVVDNGCGIARDDLPLAVERHATSKLDEEDLFNIRHLGFRGEALPSIGSIARLSIQSRFHAAPDAFEIVVDRGDKQPVKPAALNAGTRIEVQDLFSATPARLKFLKSERAENMAISDVVKRLAMAHPEIHFTLTTGERAGLVLPATGRDPEGMLARLGRIMGREFMTDALSIDAARDGVTIKGFAGLPTLNRNDTAYQFLFVNGRPVRDKMLVGTVRAAYGDMVPRGRNPMLAIFIELPPKELDVNVHPAKTEVRFRDQATVRSLLIGALRHALEGAGHRATSAGGLATIDALRRRQSLAQPAYQPVQGTPPAPSPYHNRSTSIPFGLAETMQAPFDVLDMPSADTSAAVSTVTAEMSQHPLGAARAQLHDTYIVAETATSIVIV
ncbi:MAG: mismatch repair protein MutL, partial [Pseudomonadota bacterium]